MTSSSTPTDEIQRQMADIRCHAHERMDRLVGNARTMMDWRYYVRTHPWTCVSAAAAVGFLAVPRKAEVVRTADADTLSRMATEQQFVVQPAAAERPRAGLVGALASIALSFAARSAMQLAASQGREWLAALAAGMADRSKFEPNGAASHDQPQPHI